MQAKIWKTNVERSWKETGFLADTPPKEPLVEIYENMVLNEKAWRLTWKETTAKHTMQSQSIDKAFLRLRRPE
jgi:hypothetical protein